MNDRLIIENHGTVPGYVSIMRAGEVVHVPPEPSVVLIDSGAIWTIAAVLVLRRICRWMVKMYWLGVLEARCGR